MMTKKNQGDRFEVNPESWTQLKGSLQNRPRDLLIIIMEKNSIKYVLNNGNK